MQTGSMKLSPKFRDGLRKRKNMKTKNIFSPKNSPIQERKLKEENKRKLMKKIECWKKTPNKENSVLQRGKKKEV